MSDKIKTKVCITCKEEKTLDCFYLNQKIYYRSYCKSCSKLKLKEIRRSKSKDDLYLQKQKQKKWIEANKEKVKKYVLKWQNNNRQKMREYTKKGRHNLVDYYIVKLFRKNGFTAEQITPDIIELKRLQLQGIRTVKQLKQKTNEKQ